MSPQPTLPPTPGVVFCPKCGTKSPSTHAFCPSCGSALSSARHGSAPATNKRDVKQDVADIRRVGFWIALFVTLPTLTVPALAEKLLAPGQFGLDEARSLWEVFSLTAPLTAAFAIFGVGLARDWFTNGYVTVVVAGAIVAATTVMANALSFGAGVSVADVLYASNYHPIQFAQNMVVRYYEIYGFWSFMSSLVMGGFLAWIWAEKALPYMTTSQ